MKKLMLAFLMLFFLACVPLKPKPADLHAGADAVKVDFVANAPPESVYEQTPIPLVVLLKNDGAYDIINGYLALAVDKYISLVSEPVTAFNLAGRTPYTPQGESQYINFIANAIALDPQSQIHSAEIRATVCYPYKTQATANVCVDTAIYRPNVRDKPCEVKSLKFSGQGAPVGISRVDTNMIPAQGDMVIPEFIIYIDNLGKGLVVDSGRILDACSGFALGQPFYNIVKVNARLSDMPLSCTRELKLLKKGTNFIRCVGSPLSMRLGTYPSPLMIKVDYGYVQSVSKIIKILNK